MNPARELIAAEARRWIGTPFHHRSAVFGVGVDCVNLVRVSFEAAGLGHPSDELPQYSRQWHLHRREAQPLQDFLAARARRVAEPQIGDVLAMRFGRAGVAHAAIVVGPDHIVHAYAVTRVVELLETRAFADRIDSVWSAFDADENILPTLVRH